VKIKAKAMGVGHALGENTLTNEDLEKMVETNDQWITERTGIKERRIANETTYTSDLALKAAKEALADAKMEGADIDLIIVASVTPDYMTPTLSCRLQYKLGAEKAAAYDINMACSGFVAAVVMAEQFIENGTYENVLVVGADALSKVTDYTDRATCILFGDGAGAMILSANKDENDKSGILVNKLTTTGSGGDLLTLPFIKKTEEDMQKRLADNPYVIWMDGGAVLKYAVRAMASITNETLKKANLTIDDIDILIPHQANLRIVDGAIKRIGIDTEKVYINIAHYGNMSAACIPIAIYEAVKEGRVKRGDTVLLVGFGGGLTAGCIILTW